jgi:hypothetical protein
LPFLTLSKIMYSLSQQLTGNVRADHRGEIMKVGVKRYNNLSPADARILQIAVSSGRDKSIPIQDLIRRHADSEDLGKEMLALADILRSFEDPHEDRGTHVVSDRDEFKSLLHFLWSSVVHPVICSLGLEASWFWDYLCLELTPSFTEV